MRFRDVIARALITGRRAFRDVLRESFVQPARDSIRVIAMKNQMGDLVPENVAAEFVSRIAHDKQASLRMDPACPRLQSAELLKLLPIGRLLKNIDVGLRIAGGRLAFALKLLRHGAIMKLRFHRKRRDDKAVDEVINEMLGLAVLPLLRMDRERFLAERVGIALAEAGKLHFGQRVQAWR